METLRALLALADGTTIEGEGIGAPGRAVGEVVFNTSMTGYVEALTDPSYKGQILLFTYPLIGNYATPPHGESTGIRAEGTIVRESCRVPSHWESNRGLDAWLRSENIPGMAGVDTRALVRRIRSHGVIPGVLEVGRKTPRPEALREEARRFDLGGVDWVPRVATRETIRHTVEKPRYRVVLIDCGVKMNMVRELNGLGAEVIQVPPTLEAKEIMALEPHGVVVSNGPGDPAVCAYAHRTIRGLAEQRLPLFGICLGHQLLALAMGGKTYKLKFGHRGSNQPVKDLETGRVFITSQNHGYAVDPRSLESTGLRVTKVNANDGTVEGMGHTELPLSSVQYHPEAAPGPRDSRFLFGEFLRLIETTRGKR
ncbi:MAG: glutamine-hydrolyzing carbamoyl-phosphate synthase small subunit [Euryarchaeota archaeon]|nr:glutamine-hydrolyzing carbamoyl-phosphate synthase small subunit [Euryarchaeota archaeon]